jgi:zinc protease
MGIAPLRPLVAAQQASTALADDTLQTAFPIDPNVRIDTLENGLRYYVRANAEPRNRAELYLAVDAGSILEEEPQLGLAHFVEHMLFNGTRSYPDEKLIDFLESTGMRFGPDVNAYTSFDETVYTLTIPTDSSRIVSGAFDVLQEWAAHATLSDSMIDKERGVVVEEWRMSDQNAQGRIRDQLLPVLLHDSRYAERLPIGTPEVIRNASYETIRRFYERWYRPDLMAVIAVGDFDPDQFEALIREHFSVLPRPDAAADRAAYEVPGHDSTLFKVITDPEYPYATVTAYYKQEADQVETMADYRHRLIGRLFNDMLNARLAEISRRADAPFLGASVFKGAFVRSAQFYGASAQVDEDSVLTGLQAVLTEVARVRRHGFTETELERQKQEVIRAYRRAYDEREKTNSGAFAQEYVSHFLENEPTPGIELEYEAVLDLLPTIAAEHVNTLASDLVASENRVVVSIMPEKDDVAPPTEQQLRSALDAVREATVEPYVDTVQGEPLVASVPAAAGVVHRSTIDELGVTEIELANGVRVVMKPTDFKEDEIVMSAFSPGGSSLVPDSAAFSAQVAPQLVSRSGVGAFDRTSLEKHLSGKVVSVSPYVGEIEEGFRGSASPEDLETLLQLTYLYVTEPRGEPDALAAFQNQMRSALVNRSTTPNAVFQDSLQAALYGQDVRRLPPTTEMVETLAIDRALGQYRDRFADAGEFTFVFVGSFEVDVLTGLAQHYLGALPSTGRDETWRDVQPEKPAGIVEREVRKGLGDQSYVALVFHGPFEYDRLHRHRIRSLGDALSIVLRRELREAMSGVYGVGVNPGTSARPDEEYSFTISFGCAPDRVEELKQAVFDQLERMKAAGPDADVVTTVKEQQRRERETDLRTNGFWSGVLEFYYTHDEDILDALRYDELIESLTAEELQEAARAYLDDDRYVEVVLFPLGSEEAVTSD